MFDVVHYIIKTILIEFNILFDIKYLQRTKYLVKIKLNKCGI